VVLGGAVELLLHGALVAVLAVVVCAAVVVLQGAAVLLPCVL
jgi:hypothetical protein